MDYSHLQNGTDIRGIALPYGEQPVTLTDEAVVAITKGFYAFLAKRTGKTDLTVAVGHDSRITAPRVAECVRRGVTESGGRVILTGLSSTPSMFMLLHDGAFPACDGSIMLTASHLPYYRNGMKFFTAEGGLESADIREILRIADREEFLSGEGWAEERSYLRRYAETLVEFVRSATGERSPLLGKKIVVDAGNGAGGFYATEVLVPLGADIDGSQFLEPDGNFPNHIPNPENPEAMQSISAAVKKSGADFGIIFDTDVDRAGAVDSRGEEINRNRLIALISAVLLKEKKGTVVTDSITSDGLSEFICAAGGRHRRFKRGYKNVINEAKRLNAEGVYAPLAIETSGHAALKENYFLDDGAYLVTRLLIALSKEAKEGRSVTDLISSLKDPAESEEVRLNFLPEVDFRKEGEKALSLIEAAGKSAPYVTFPAENYEGVRLNFDREHGDGWMLCRMSLHEPVFPVNAESDSPGGCRKMFDFLKECLKDCSCFADFEKLDP